MLTLKEVRKKAVSLLEETEIRTARLDVDLLLGLALGLDPLEIILDPCRKVPDHEAAAFRALLARRAAREPMSQILGKKAFWSLDFKVSRDCLTPRPDSEILIESALKAIPDRNKPLKILDLGTGSGCLLLSLMAELPDSRGVGVDISARALMLAQGNADRLGFGDRCEFIRSDWAAQLPPSAEFDIILANPPYIARAERVDLAPEARDYEPDIALFADDNGLKEYKKLAKIIPQLIAVGGHAFLEIGWRQGSQVRDIFSRTPAENITIIADLAGRDRCIALDFA